MQVQLTLIPDEVPLKVMGVPNEPCARSGGTFGLGPGQIDRPAGTTTGVLTSEKCDRAMIVRCPILDSLPRAPLLLWRAIGSLGVPSRGTSKWKSRFPGKSQLIHRGERHELGNQQFP